MKHFALIALALLILSACQDVVDIDVPSADTELVVEGSISDLDPARVLLSTTAPFLGDDETPKLSNAVVEVYENDTLFEQLQEVDSIPGLYRGTQVGEIGKEYHLEIRLFGNYPEGVTGQWRSGQSRLKPVAQIDSMKTRRLDRNTTPNVFNPGVYALLFFQERPGRGDFTRVHRWLNDSLFQRQVVIIEDEGIDGVYFGQGLFPPIAIYGPFDEQDTLADGTIDFVVRFESISKDQADYLRLISEQTQVGSPFDAPPALIIGNIRKQEDSSDYAFGYFQASAVSEAQVRYDP